MKADSFVLLLPHWLVPPNPVNGFAHTLVASGPNNTLTIADLIAMKVAFDKANVPLGGRVAIVDPITAASLDSLVSMTSDISDFGKKSF